MQIEIETEGALRVLLETRGDLRGVVVQRLDLRPLSDTLAKVDARGAVFLGCTFDTALLAHVLGCGAMVFPALDGLPFEPYRQGLYTPDELLEGFDREEPQSFWTASRDARIYAWYERTRKDAAVPVLDALAQRLHDHAIDDALGDLLHDPRRARKVVGVMGGHGMKRGDPAYRDVARLARRLAERGYFLVSGGGPGAMEATNLGAWYSTRPEAELDAAVHVLSRAPTYRDDGWIATALDVRSAVSHGGESLGVPTWFYGHEPPNVFAAFHAKYFSNSIREDGLLAIARHGVIYAPGSAGTIQEIFQDAAQNHYGTCFDVSPMIFLGTKFWTEERPVYPLLAKLAEGHTYGAMLSIHDEVDAVVRFLEEHPPVPFVK